MIRKLIAALLLAVSILAPRAALADPADIAAAARSVVRVVLITTDEEGVMLVGHGSGFAVGPDLVVTNAHVVAPLARDKSMRAGVVPSQGSSGYFARIVAYSPRNDLALLRLAEPGSLAPATLFTGAVTDGEDIWAVGYPGNVDRAQGLRPEDLMRPTAPVKTHGNVSGGRASKNGFDTLLHTAQIASGNSGGPVLDTCGRVVGVNSFGTTGESGADSAFYFAVSMRELSRFLLQNGVKTALTGEPCRSLAEFQSAEEQRLAQERQAADARQAAALASRDADLERATRRAELDVLAGRENRMALALVAFVFALIAGGGAAWFGRSAPNKRKASAIASAALMLGAITAWFTRPSLDEIDARAQEILDEASPAASASPAQVAPISGEWGMICVIDSARSRITVSPITDVPVDWSSDGCVNRRTQYGFGADGWSRVLVPNQEDTVTVASYAPAGRTYTTDRYLLDADTMAKVREARGKYELPQCGAGEAAARALGESQAAIKALLPPQPNERLVYRCAPGG